ncbi:hypothetical protein L7815_010860 [Serratia marcescens]|uniref:hypothetical protein n=1 Tax=Serratia marcescens TaxID=615 RepID=UPI001EE6FDCA|nr:hypothetical protein [Serratia marcescens]MCG5374434.1 hypothetical protein [Serratia marcescens]
MNIHFNKSLISFLRVSNHLISLTVYLVVALLADVALTLFQRRQATAADICAVLLRHFHNFWDGYGVHRTHLISRNKTALPGHARLSSSIFVVDRVGSYLQKNSKLRPAMKQ